MTKAKLPVFGRRLCTFLRRTHACATMCMWLWQHHDYSRQMDAGFFAQGGNLSSPLYNGTLTTFYLLMIVFGWNERRIKRIEPILHAVPLVLGWGTAIAGLALKLFPRDCKISFEYGPDEANCIRGNNWDFYRLIFMYIPTWSTMIYVVIVMAVIYYSVLKTERRTDRYATDQSQKKRTQSRRIANQSMAYVGSLFLTHIFNGTLTRLIELFVDRPPYPVILLMTIFLPLQGFTNFLIYMRPRYLTFRNKHKNLSWFAVMRVALCSSCCSGEYLDWNKKQEDQQDEENADGNINLKRDTDFPLKNSNTCTRISSVVTAKIVKAVRRLSNGSVTMGVTTKDATNNLSSKLSEPCSGAAASNTAQRQISKNVGKHASNTTSNTKAADADTTIQRELQRAQKLEDSRRKMEAVTSLKHMTREQNPKY